jgi:OOP family OmpA-OmpF porin
MNAVKVIVSAIALAGVFVSSTDTLAQQRSTSWYVGGGLGQSKIKLNDPDFSVTAPLSQTRNESDSAWKVFAGYNFSSIFGAELGYAKPGTASVAYSLGAGASTSLDYETTSWTLAATARLPLGRLGLMGRLGVARNEADHTIGPATGALAAALLDDGFRAGSSASHKKYSPYWGLGAQYDFARHLSVRLDYDNFGKFGDEAETGRAKVGMWSINAVVRF